MRQIQRGSLESLEPFGEEPASFVSQMRKLQPLEEGKAREGRQTVAAPSCRWPGQYPRRSWQIPSEAISGRGQSAGRGRGQRDSEREAPRRKNRGQYLSWEAQPMQSAGGPDRKELMRAASGGCVSGCLWPLGSLSFNLGFSHNL